MERRTRSPRMFRRILRRTLDPAVLRRVLGPCAAQGPALWGAMSQEKKRAKLGVEHATFPRKGPS
eukprot:scaffold21213_cov142-Isochrysis_galbana.AAC.2